MSKQTPACPTFQGVGCYNKACKEPCSHCKWHEERNYSFIHTGDWHVGATRNLTPGSLAYLERQEQTLLDFEHIIKQLRPDFMLIAGDILDNNKTTIEEFNMLIRVLKRLGSYIPIVIEPGNHDELQTGEFQIKWLIEHEIPNVRIITKPEALTLKLSGGREVGIAGIPWTGIKDQDQFDLHVSSHLRPDTEIVMLHECFAGSVVDSGHRFPGGIRVPDIPGIVYYACGDIHKAQEIGMPNAWFSGAPMQYKFDDKANKGCLIVDVEDGIATPRFEPLHCPILLKQIRSLDEAVTDGSFWYSLNCRADQIPLEQPPYVKKIVPQPVKIEMPDQQATPNAPRYSQIQVDYAEGVDQMMGELGYTQDEISGEQEHIRQLARQ